MKIKYPSITADKVCNFIRIYLCYNSTKNIDYFLPEKQVWIRSFGFVGPYLKEEGDPEYFWMNEYNGSCLHFLLLFLARQKKSSFKIIILRGS